MAGMHAKVSTLKSCLKKADRVSPFPKRAKTVDFTIWQQYKIYEYEPEERDDTDKYPIEAGEISWAEMRDLLDANYEDTHFLREEAAMIIYNMENKEDWDPGRYKSLSGCFDAGLADFRLFGMFYRL